MILLNSCLEVESVECILLDYANAQEEEASLYSLNNLYKRASCSLVKGDFSSIDAEFNFSSAVAPFVSSPVVP